MIYEFIGLPGSGKTYRARCLSEELGLPFVCDVDRTNRLLGSLYFMCRHPRIFTRLCVELLKESHVSVGLLRHKIFFLLGNTLAREAQAECLGSAVIDEGLGQYFYSLYEHPVGTPDIEEYFKIIRLSKKRSIIILNVDESIRHKRMAARGRVPRSTFGPLYGESWNTSIVANHRLVLEHLPKISVGATIEIEESF